MRVCQLQARASSSRQLVASMKRSRAAAAAATPGEVPPPPRRAPVPPRPAEPIGPVLRALPPLADVEDPPLDEARARRCAEVMRNVDELSARLAPLTASPPPPVSLVYDAHTYARAPYERYVRRYGGREGIRVLFVGMNPGPFGMAQTGIPFGTISLVREWMGIEGEVGKPPVEHPSRPVQGFQCPREEVSGARLWGWAKARCGDPHRFFRHAFVLNYCPQVWMNATGGNMTPDKLEAKYRKQVLEACDDALRRTLELLKPEMAVGVGVFAVDRIKAVAPPGLKIAKLPHPSPASPAANKDWPGQADAAMRAAGIDMSTWE